MAGQTTFFLEFKMLKSDLKVGDIVLFGKKKGEKTKAKIVKLNQKRAKVETLEPRGTNGQHPVGGLWNVPYSLIVNKAPAATPPQEPVYATDDPFSPDQFSPGYSDPVNSVDSHGETVDAAAEKIKEELFDKIRAGGNALELAKVAIVEAIWKGIEIKAAA